MRYEIKGDTLPVAVCSLQRGEALYCEAGAMSWMTDGIRMETEGGGIGKVFGRMFSGETLFRNRYTAERDGEIAFASSFPGSIIAVELSAGRTVIAQKRSFLACDSGVAWKSFSRKDWERASSAEKASSCRNFPETARCFWKSTVPRWNTSWKRDSG